MITCWLTRREIAKNLDDGTILQETAHKHLHHCAACECHYQQQRQLVAQLSNEAHIDSVEPSPFLRGKIVAAVRRAADSETVSTPSPRFAWSGGFAFSALAALVIVFGIVWNQPDPNPPSAELLTKVIQLSGDQVLEETTGQNFEAWTVALNQPLESEIDFVMNDARLAIDSLAASFIPESLFAANTTFTQ